MSDNLDEFLRDLTRIEAAVPQVFGDFRNDVTATGYEAAIVRSPVRTGAYRSEHLIASGKGRPGAFVYESSTRVGPDRVVPPGGAVIGPPSVAQARNAIARRPAFETLWLWNQRFYASFIENGSSAQAPQGVYRQAEDVMRGRAREIGRQRDRRLE